MDGVVVVDAPEEAQSVEAQSVEAQSVEAQSVEAVADASVEVAAIEADARVEIASIEAETHVAAIEVAREERTDEWRSLFETLAAELSDARQAMTMQAEQINQLTETVTAQAAAIALILDEGLTPPPSIQETPSGEPEAEPGADLDGPEEVRPASGPQRRERKWM